MALIVLPRNTGAEAAEQARQKLQAAIDDPVTVVMIVYGEGPHIEKALEVCVARASVKALIRRVVWIPDSSVLSTELKRRFWRSGKVAVAIGLDDQVAAALSKARAKARIFVEEAFLGAESHR
ncbi:MAG: hypothetical protein GTN62_12260 [Gemmatimonadales bacterium]|nr:hypothetical protein [Gemmatimonadales bacterium]NIN12498.1 hypothetical protein [Gemmatimonadales bacterium]NIN50869.1 hypothetical protein [Gemmatimonadales bacterium]NIP08333.1 hypothetical protein [Gemmatimonadales bacterium]NIR03430.1 hypothetical protein [Gemmatimonadales bacterium]